MVQRARIVRSVTLGTEHKRDPNDEAQFQSSNWVPIVLASQFDREIHALRVFSYLHNDDPVVAYVRIPATTCARIRKAESNG